MFMTFDLSLNFVRLHKINLMTAVDNIQTRNRRPT